MAYAGPVRGQVQVRRVLLAMGVLVAGVLPLAGGRAESLRPSRASLSIQNRQAQAHDFTYIRNPEQLDHFVRKGWLVRLTGNRDYRLYRVSFPYVRPETRMFVERLSSQYRSACGERLVVTSATRPKSHQPRNASPDSVHPTGMALDLRRSSRRSCRQWLDRTLVYLEGRGVLEASIERWPPHYHLAVFPEPYSTYVKSLGGQRHRVRRGESLWAIARRYGTTVTSLRSVNRLRGDRILPGQVLNVPPS